MGEASKQQVTRLLREWRSGRESAREELWPLVYGELRQLAGSFMRDQRQGHTLQATALVHEAFVRLVDADLAAESRAEFLGLAATAMRNLLIDHARSRGRAKRGAGESPVTLDEAVAGGFVQASTDLLDLDRALTQLAERDARKAQAVELHFFGGLTYEEIAALLGVSLSTVRGDLRFARAWLRAQLEG